VISSRTDISAIRQKSMMLVFRDTGIKGRGIFAHQDFAKGELTEITPIIVIPKQQVKLIVKNVLLNYYFGWHGESGAIALGFASLFNHSYHPNALYIENIAKSVIEIIAHQDIRKGQEITINYNGQVDDQSPV
jgi:SET domain-containing protein